MLTVDGHWHCSPQDVLAQLECDHRARLDHAAAHQLIARPASESDATLDLIAQHGLTHEQSALEAMKSLVGGDLVEMGPPSSDRDELHAAAAETRAALDAGVGAVYQAVLLVDGFLGYADFVTSVHPASGEVMLDGDGRRRYEPVDAKLARSAKPGALLQAACYADALVRLGHPEPRQVHLWLGDSTVESAHAADLIPLAGEYRERVQGRLAAQPVLPEPTWGDAGRIPVRATSSPRDLVPQKRCQPNLQQSRLNSAIGGHLLITRLTNLPEQYNWPVSCGQAAAAHSTRCSSLSLDLRWPLEAVHHTRTATPPAVLSLATACACAASTPSPTTPAYLAPCTSA